MFQFHDTPTPKHPQLLPMEALHDEPADMTDEQCMRFLQQHQASTEEDLGLACRLMHENGWVTTEMVQATCDAIGKALNQIDGFLQANNQTHDQEDTYRYEEGMDGGTTAAGEDTTAAEANGENKEEITAEAESEKKEEIAAEGDEKKEEIAAEANEKKEEIAAEANEKKEEIAAEANEKKEEIPAEGNEKKEEIPAEANEKKEGIPAEGNEKKEEIPAEANEKKEGSTAEAKGEVSDTEIIPDSPEEAGDPNKKIEDYMKSEIEALELHATSEEMRLKLIYLKMVVNNEIPMPKEFTPSSKDSAAESAAKAKPKGKARPKRAAKAKASPKGQAAPKRASKAKVKKPTKPKSRSKPKSNEAPEQEELLKKLRSAARPIYKILLAHPLECH